MLSQKKTRERKGEEEGREGGMEGPTDRQMDRGQREIQRYLRFFVFHFSWKCIFVSWGGLSDPVRQPLGLMPEPEVHREAWMVLDPICAF